MMPSSGISQNRAESIELYREKSLGKSMVPADTAYSQIKKLASNSELWKKLLIRSEQEIFQRKKFSDDHMSNCKQNAYLLNVLFVGELQAKKVAILLSFTANEKISLYGPYASKYLNLHIHFVHFLSGNAVLDVNKGPVSLSDWSREKSPEYTKCLKLFKEHIVDLYTTGLVSKEIYSFNDHVIDNLQLEIAKNKNEISEHCSYIYHIAIVVPDPEVVESSSIETILNAPLGIHHAFNLEQCYDFEKNSVCVRLHHAWKDEFSLSEYYDRYGDDQLDEQRFFNDLKSMLAYDDSEAFSNLEKHQYSCFKVKTTCAPALLIRNELGLYIGDSVRYVTSKVNPQECLKNINEIVKRYGD